HAPVSRSGRTFNGGERSGARPRRITAPGTCFGGTSPSVRERTARGSHAGTRSLSLQKKAAWHPAPPPEARRPAPRAREREQERVDEVVDGLTSSEALRRAARGHALRPRVAATAGAAHLFAGGGRRIGDRAPLKAAHRLRALR